MKNSPMARKVTLTLYYTLKSKLHSLTISTGYVKLKILSNQQGMSQNALLSHPLDIAK